MTPSRPPRRPQRPPSAAAVEPPVLAAFPIAHEADDADTANTDPAPTAAENDAAPAHDAWRDRLDALRAEGLVDERQDADLHRLFDAQATELRTVMPGLLDAFRRDLDAHGPDQAKQTLTAALQAIKDRHRDDTWRTLESIGADVSELRR